MEKRVPVVLHVPHSSRGIPFWVRPEFLLRGKNLKKEIVLMTDSFTRHLFGAAHGLSLNHASCSVCAARVSRLVVDVERFADDAQEIMSKVGMGVVYTRTSEGKALRRKISECEKRLLVSKFYGRHHRRFEKSVSKNLSRFGFCLIVDCHSFSSFRQKYEVNEDLHRSEICIGTDAFHTAPWLENLFVEKFRAAGFDVGLNSPFAGSIVPMKFYGTEKRVQSVMVEVRRDLYMDESTGKKLASYGEFRRKLGAVLVEIFDSLIDNGTLVASEYMW